LKFNNPVCGLLVAVIQREERCDMIDDLILLALVVVLVPLAAIVTFRLLGKTKRTRRPLNSFRIER